MDRRNVFYGTAGAVLLAFAVILVNRNAAWDNNLTLFTAGAVTSPNSERAQAALANELRNQADRVRDPAQHAELIRQAVAHFQRATAIYAGDADAWYNQGLLYTTQETGRPR